MDTGDAGMIDEDGYVHVMSRSDDIINVAAHRFSTGKPIFPDNKSSTNTDKYTGAIEQAILSTKGVAAAAVIGIPDPMKGHLPFAFIEPNTSSTEDMPATPPKELFDSINKEVRAQIGAIASLGGIIQGKGMIPKTRSGKTLRRVLRELVEHAVEGNFDKAVNIPPTVEDKAVVEVARERVKQFFKEKGLKEGGDIKAKL